uniref:Uncharacterized protein n=1 Tax=Arundo donax TaxID=35708 RepID=A0A0A8YYM0_ARUDO
MPDLSEACSNEARSQYLLSLDTSSFMLSTAASICGFQLLNDDAAASSASTRSFRFRS